MLFAVAAVLLASGPVRAQSSLAAAERFVADLGKRTLAVLADPDLERERKTERLVSLVDEATDLNVIARLAIGRAWRDLSEPKKAEYVDLFRAMVRQTLAQRLGSYSGETFVLAGARSVDQRDSVVTTLIGRDGQRGFRVEWRVRSDSDGRLAIVDVIAEGVSMLLTQRSEFGDILQREGVDGLLGRLRARAEREPASGNVG